RQQNAVRQYLSQQKAQQATTNLLRELHGSSYVDVR
ncbi:peptidylprolyl isomerase, partial [Neisseria sp. P0016.S002]